MVARAGLQDLTYENHRWYGPSYVYKAEDGQKLRIAINEKQLPLAANGQGASLAEDFKSSIVKGKEMATEIAEARNALSSVRKKKDVNVKAHVRALIPDGQGDFKLVSGEGLNPKWRQMHEGRGKEGEPLKSFKKDKGAEGERNWDQRNADAEFASVEDMINQLRKNDPNVFKDTAFHYSVSGLDVCDNCLVDIPDMARQLGLKEVFLYEESTGKILHWSRVTNLDSLQPLGRFISYNPQKLKAATIGVSQYNQQGKREGQ